MPQQRKTYEISHTNHTTFRVKLQNYSNYRVKTYMSVRPAKLVIPVPDRTNYKEISSRRSTQVPPRNRSRAQKTPPQGYKTPRTKPIMTNTTNRNG